jgi:protease-4
VWALYLFNNEVLIISIEGSIVDFEETTLALHMAMVDPKIKSVIIYLNTPGGLAFACMEISRYVSELAKIKPVIAVMGAQCASGGYLIASHASVIYTHQNTITGAIGVLAVWVDLSEYYEKEGIKVWVWTSGEEKDFGAEWRSPTEEEQRRMQSEIDSLYQTIMDTIVMNRDLSLEVVDEISTGRIFSGIEAVDLGLADEIGDLIDALETAQNLTNLWRFLIVTSEMDNRAKILKALFEI